MTLVPELSDLHPPLHPSSARPANSDVARGRMPAVTPWYEGRGTPGLFVLGTAAHSRDYRSSAGGFIHGFRYTGEGLVPEGTGVRVWRDQDPG